MTRKPKFYTGNMRANGVRAFSTRGVSAWVFQATKFELVINLKTVKALGVAIPSGVFAITDEVIE